MLPKAILFDYGMTLCTEPDADYEKGAAVLLSHAAANPQHITPPALQKAIWDVLADFGFAGVELDRSADAIWAQKLEVHFLGVLRYVLERLGLVLDVDLWHAEMLYWDACSPGSPAPGAAEMLEYLDALSIPYGVVSNMWFTGATLERRIVSCLPHANFRFILASHDYAYRKPDRHFFEIALHKLGLSRGDVWFCGDNPVCDVEGAAGVGMRPFWLRLSDDFDRLTPPRVPYTRLTNWADFCRLLEKAAQESR